MKIDIVDLMDFYWNDAPSPDAAAEPEEMLKQGGTWVLKRETRRYRNRPLLAAVVILLAVLVAMPFALPRITGDPTAANTKNAQSTEASNGYRTARPDGNPAAESAENAQSTEASDDYQTARAENTQSAETDHETAHIAGLLLPSAVYPVALEIPAEYVEEIEVDTPYQDIPMFEYEIQYDNAVFSFYDKSSQTYGLIGLVWCILATPKNEYTPLGPEDDYIYEYNRAELGADEDYVYELIYPRAGRQCNINDSENVDSYFTHIAIGQDLLTQFIQQNSLQSDGTGVERYAAFVALQKNGCSKMRS